MSLLGGLKNVRVVALSAESGDPSANEKTEHLTTEFLGKMCGLDPLEPQEEQACIQLLQKDAIDLDARIHAAMPWRDPLFDNLTYCGFSDRTLEMVLGQAQTGRPVLDHLLSHIHTPHSERILPFWLPEDTSARQGLPGFASQNNASTQASALSWQTIMMHPETRLDATNTKGCTVMDLWAHRFAQQTTRGSLELTKSLNSYRRLCLLMELGAPLHHYRQVAEVTDALAPIAHDYAQKFTDKTYKPIDIDPVIFRHWSICGMLDAMMDPALWQGNEAHLAGLWASLPENERAPHAHRATSSLLKHFAPPPSTWSNEVTTPPASNRGRG